MNDVAKMAMEGILEEGMAFFVFQAHVESDSQELFLRKMETAFHVLWYGAYRDNRRSREATITSNLYFIFLVLNLRQRYEIKLNNSSFYNIY